MQLVPVHEVGDARRGLDLGVGHARSLELEEHGHAVAAETEEHALAQAENAGVAPAQHQADGDERVGQILADQIEPEDVDARPADTITISTSDQGEADSSSKLTVLVVGGRHRITF